MVNFVDHFMLVFILRRQNVITAADIRREVKEKCYFYSLDVSDILGTMKNVEIPATDEQLDKVLSNKPCLMVHRRICP